MCECHGLLLKDNSRFDKNGNESNMLTLMKYEENGDARILKNTPFTTNKFHIGFGTEDITKYNTLSSNPNYSHTFYTQRDDIPDMKPIKGTQLIAQVSGCSQPNSDGKWKIDHSLLPRSCPPCSASLN